MSHDEIEDLGFEERYRLLELYMEDCQRQGIQATMKDFVIWLGER